MEQSTEDIALVVDRELDDNMWELAIPQCGWMVEPFGAAPAIEGDEYVAIQADERQQEKRDTVDDEGSTRNHLIDGGRMTEHGW
jgi:hypothetical protein